MKRLFFSMIVLAGLASCTTKPDKSADAADSLAGPPAVESIKETSTEVMCFQRLTGTANQDTTKLRLEIAGQQVSGDFAHYPYEKDRRVGTIAATKTGNLIKGQWFFMQEGMNDTLDVEFQLDGDQLMQRSYTVDPKTGREVISDASTFSLSFTKTNCE